jgi:hypothetical protein
MKNVFCSLLLTFALTAFSQAVTITEDFDDYSGGTTGTAAGWVGLFGGNPDNWTVTVPPTAGDPSTASFVEGSGTSDMQMYKTFDIANTFTSSDTVYYSVWVRPQQTGGLVKGIRFGATTSDNKPTYLFGVSATDATLSTFRFFVGSEVSTNLYDANDWYQLMLVIDQSTGSTNATGTLMARNVTDGETVFSTVAGLENISLGLTSSTEVSDWTAWLIRSSYRQEIDNLYLSTNIPEPSSVAAMLGIFALLAGLILRRRK